MAPWFFDVQAKGQAAEDAHRFVIIYEKNFGPGVNKD